MEDDEDNSIEVISTAGMSMDKVVKCIYSACDPKGADSVSVSLLIEFVKPYMPDNLSELAELQRQLDPNNDNPNVSSKTFYDVMSKWTSKIANRLEDTFSEAKLNDSTAFSGEGFHLVHSTPQVANGYQELMKNYSEMLNYSSIEFLQSENDNTAPSDKLPLEERVKELQHQVNKATNELQQVKFQLSLAEEQNEVLLADINKVTKSLQTEQQINEQLRKNKLGNEEFREEANVAKKKIDQLHRAIENAQKERQGLLQEISQLEQKKAVLERKVEELQEREKEARKQIIDMKNEIDLKEAEISGLIKFTKELKSQLEEKDDLIVYYTNENELAKHKADSLQKLFRSNLTARTDSILSEYKEKGHPSIESPSSDSHSDEIYSVNGDVECILNSPTLIRQINNPVTPNVSKIVMDSPRKSPRSRRTSASLLKYVLMKNSSTPKPTNTDPNEESDSSDGIPSKEEYFSSSVSPINVVEAEEEEEEPEPELTCIDRGPAAYARGKSEGTGPMEKLYDPSVKVETKLRSPHKSLFDELTEVCWKPKDSTNSTDDVQRLRLTLKEEEAINTALWRNIEQFKSEISTLKFQKTCDREQFLDDIRKKDETIHHLQEMNKSYENLLNKEREGSNLDLEISVDTNGNSNAVYGTCEDLSNYDNSEILTDLERKIRCLHSDLNFERNQKTILSNRLASGEDEICKLKEIHKHLNAKNVEEINTLKRKLSNAEALLDIEKFRCGEFQHDLALKLVQNEHITENFESLKKQYEQIKAKQEAIVIECNELQIENQNKQSVLLNKISSLEESILTVTAENEILQAANEDAQHQKHLLQKEILSSEETNSALISKYEVLQAQKTLVDSEESATLQENDSLKATVLELSKKNEELREQKSVIGQKLADKEEILKENAIVCEVLNTILATFSHNIENILNIPVTFDINDPSACVRDFEKAMGTIADQLKVGREMFCNCWGSNGANETPPPTGAKKTNFEKLQLKIDKLQDKIHYFESDIKEERKRTEELDCRIRQLTQENLSLTQVVCRNEEEKQNLSASQKNLESEIVTLQMEMFELEQDLERAKLQAKQFKDESKVLTGSNFNLNLNLQKCANDLQAERSVVLKVQEDCRRLLNKLQHCERQFREEEATCATMRREVVEVITNSNLKKGQFEKTIAEKESTIKQLKLQLQTSASHEDFLDDYCRFVESCSEALKRTTAGVIHSHRLQIVSDSVFIKTVEEMALFERRFPERLEKVTAELAKEIERTLTVMGIMNKRLPYFPKIDESTIIEDETSNSSGRHTSEGLDLSDLSDYSQMMSILGKSKRTTEEKIPSGSSRKIQGELEDIPDQSAFPDESDAFMDNLQLLNNEILRRPLTLQEMEEKFTALAMTYTFESTKSQERHKKQKERYEKQVTKFFKKLNSAIMALKRHNCSETFSRGQFELLKTISSKIFSSAECFGALQYEIRTLKCWNMVINYVSSLKEQSVAKNIRPISHSSEEALESFVMLKRFSKKTEEVQFSQIGNRHIPFFYRRGSLKRMSRDFCFMCLCLIILFFSLLIYIQYRCSLLGGNMICPFQYIFESVAERTSSDFRPY